MEQDQNRMSTLPGKQEALWHADCSPAAGPLMRQAKHSQIMVSGFPKAALHIYRPHNHNTFFNSTIFKIRCFFLKHEAHLFCKRFVLFTHVFYPIIRMIFSWPSILHALYFLHNLPWYLTYQNHLVHVVDQQEILCKEKGQATLYITC